MAIDTSRLNFTLKELAAILLHNKPFNGDCGMELWLSISKTTEDVLLEKYPECKQEIKDYLNTFLGE